MTFVFLTEKRVKEKPSEPSVTEDERRREHETDQVWLIVVVMLLHLRARQNLLCHLIPAFSGVERNWTSLHHQRELKGTWGNRSGERSLTQGARACFAHAFFRTERKILLLIS